MAHLLTGFNLMVAVCILTRIISGRETNVRLRNGLSELEGRVEILINGTWGTICDKNFKFNDALVVCRSLNFSGALGTTSESEFGPSSGKIHSDILRCNGTETDILECLRTNSDPKTICSSSHEAGVRCSDCRDVNPRCQSWANQDACESYPGEVPPVCQLSCDQCNTTVIDDSASYLSMNETCVAGHCYLDSNNAYRCIPAVELCVTVGWYQGLICIPTPTSPTPSSVRCMHFEEREQTNLDALTVKHKLNFTISGLAYTTSTVDEDIVFTVDQTFRIFDQLTNEGLTPRQIYDRQRQVKVLFLFHIDLHHIVDSPFTGFPSLQSLIVGENGIQEIRNTAFTGLEQLKYLNLRHNKIADIENGTFLHMKALLFLEIENNSLVILQAGVFSGLENLRELALFHNQIRSIQKGVFDGLQKLQFLYLQSNNISDIEVGAFSELGDLQILNLSSNSIKYLRSGIFSGLSSLQYLLLTDNSIHVIDGHAFGSLKSLKYLFFLGTELGPVNPDALAGLNSLEKMSTSDNRLCCLLNDKKNVSLNVTCATTSQTSPLDTCSRLYPNLALRFAGWIMGLLALGGNGAVLFIRLRDRKKQKNKVQNTMISSLALADILMGLYMIIITSADLRYGDGFYLRAPQWRDSHMCRFAGFLGFLSSEASVLTLTLITVDRFICIMFPFRPELKIQHKGSMILVGSVWVFTILLSLGLVIITSYKPDVYGLSDVCLGLPLHVEAVDTGVLEITGDFFFEYQVNYKITDVSSRPPWLFSIIIFIGFNLVSFAFILICYIMIFIESSKASEKAHKSKSNKQETKLAVRMALLVATDLACWMPVIIMGILSQSGAVTLPPSLYAWTVILIVPINSSINPFLYTFIVHIDAMKKKRKKMESKEKRVGLQQVQNKQTGNQPSAPTDATD